MNELPKFSGKSLIETPDVPMIGYLEGEFGKAFLETYNHIVDETFNGNSALKVLKFEDNVVKGSSTYASIISNGILKQNGLSLAKPVDIEFARKLYNKTSGASGLNTQGRCYVDYGVVFRSVSEPNEYLAKQLEPQIKKVCDVKKIRNPFVILSGDLNLVDNENAPKGLELSLKKNAKPFSVPALKKDFQFSETDENGMLIPDEDGNRTSYTNNSGLSGLCLARGLALYSSWGDLADSDSGGRVVVVKK